MPYSEIKEEKIDLSVIIPAFNEERNIGATLRIICNWLRKKGISFEVIVINDGSQDNTGSIVEDLRRSDRNISLIINDQNLGKGYSVKKGVLVAKGEMILVSDADSSVSIYHLREMMEYIKDGYDIVIASRYMPGSELFYPKKFREKMGRIFHWIVKLTMKIDIEDSQCGFKIFRGGPGKRIFEKVGIKRFAFDVEVLFLSQKLGYKVKEVPVRCIT
jgi:dolichyl-phosphate beta-glucosyltransferase